MVENYQSLKYFNCKSFENYLVVIFGSVSMSTVILGQYTLATDYCK